MKLSEYRQRMKALYHQLQEFRYDSQFHEWGFAVMSPYRWWHDQVDEFQAEFVNTFHDLVKEDSEVAAPIMLRMLGLNYCRYKGYGNRSADSLEDVIRGQFEAETVV